MAIFEPKWEANTVMLYGMETVAGQGISAILHKVCTSRDLAEKLAKKISSEFMDKNHEVTEEDTLEGDYLGDCIVESDSLHYYMGEEIDLDRFLRSFEEVIKEIIEGLEGAAIDEELNRLFSSRDKEFLDSFLESVVLNSR